MKMTFEKFRKCLVKNGMGRLIAPENHQFCINGTRWDCIIVPNEYDGTFYPRQYNAFSTQYYYTEELDFQIFRLLDVTAMFTPVFERKEV